MFKTLMVALLIGAALFACSQEVEQAALTTAPYQATWADAQAAASEGQNILIKFETEW